ncbi:MAG TPA: spermidine/putrescine ABC transporter substrate-binding protein [Anaerolineae bacterium]|nr:spermidine/putrescine ABC transporter substrate-binding protein [Anaerolineae bacterium]
MSRLLIRTIFLTFLSLTLIACGSNTTMTNPTATPEPTATPNRLLNIYNYDTYIDPQILTDFEGIHGVTINYEIYDSNDELYAELVANPGKYDIIVPSDYMVATMRQEDLLLRLDKTQIPNIINIAPQFTNRSYDPRNQHCIPYQWGTMAIGYNVKTIGREISSWQDFFAPELAGRIALIDEGRSMLGMTLIALGYSPNTTAEEEIKIARDFLIELAPNIIDYAPDTGQDMLLSGEADAVVEWNGDILQIMEDNPDIRYLIPDEGTIIWTDNACIPATAPNPEMAHAFLNHLLDAKVGAQLSEFISYASPNQASLALLDSETRQNSALYPPSEIREKLFYIIDLEQNNRLYDDAWAEVLEHFRANQE